MNQSEKERLSPSSKGASQLKGKNLVMGFGISCQSRFLYTNSFIDNVSISAA
jgi:hypothetical protein